MAWVAEEFMLVFIRNSSENYKLPEDEEKNNIKLFSNKAWCVCC